MNTYLTIMVTVLVATQIIRITQNAITLYRQNVLFQKQCAEIRDIEIAKEDFEMQRKAYRLIVEHLENENESALAEMQKG